MLLDSTSPNPNSVTFGQQTLIDKKVRKNVSICLNF